MRVKSLILIFALFSVIFAHPHTFIEAVLDTRFFGDKPSAVRVEWILDEMFSSQVIMEADVNQNRQLEPEEIRYIYENAFSNLVNYGYFFYQRIGSQRNSAKEVRDFQAKISNGKLVYSFVVPVQPVNPLIISLIDSSFFCALTYHKKRPVYFSGVKQIKPTYKIETNKQYPVYYNPKGAIDDDSLYKKWQPGLVTAYPEEVIITF